MYFGFKTKHTILDTTTPAQFTTPHLPYQSFYILSIFTALLYGEAQHNLPIFYEYTSVY